jgi:cell wall-associated NlpC family hydrolase
VAIRLNKKTFLYSVIAVFSLQLFSCHPSKKANTKSSDKTQVSGSSSVDACVAALLAVKESDIRDKKLYRFVCEWYGTPYKYGGCDKKGTDCSCFTSILVSSVYKKQLPRTAGEIYKSCEKVKSVKEGDLVFFKTNGKDVSHVGIFLRNNKFVHASTSKGVVINDLNDSYYKKTFYAYGRLK